MPITVVGTAIVAGTSITIPAHESGDLVVIYAHSSARASSPGAPAAGGNVPTWTTISATASGNWANCRTAYAFGTGSTTSGAWTNSTSMLMVAVLRGVNATTPVGGRSAQVNLGTNSIAPAVTMSATNGSSVLLSFHGFGDGVNAVGSINSPATGYTRQLGTVLSTILSGVINTRNVTTTGPAVTQRITGGPYNNGAQVEVLEAVGSTTTNQFFQMF